MEKDGCANTPYVTGAFHPLVIVFHYLSSRAKRRMTTKVGWAQDDKKEGCAQDDKKGGVVRMTRK